MKKAVWSIGMLWLLGTGPAGAEDVVRVPEQAAVERNDAAAHAKPRGAPDEQIAEQLKAFCRKWMGFLAVRERDNRAGIKWQNGSEGVKGQFVGYSQEYDCTLKERGAGGVPVATIQYRELIYEQAGASEQNAQQQMPNVIDATEVTEIFRYAKGEWIY